MELLNISNLCYNYGEDFYLKDIAFSLEHNKSVGLFGPSGSGKSTILRLISGLSKPQSGEILLDGQSIINQESHTRSIGMIFQHHALFPHLNVYDNIAFGLKMQQLDRDNIDIQVNSLLNVFKISKLKNRKISELSVGESQRVAIARSLAPKPKLLLMDEPFSSLDYALKVQLRLEISEILHDMNIASIVVSHDIQDIVPFSDHILLLKDGKMLFDSHLPELYSDPKLKDVGSMLGFFSLKDFLAGIKDLNTIVPDKLKDVDYDHLDFIIHPDNLFVYQKPNPDMFAVECRIEKIFYSGPNPQVILQRVANGDSAFISAIWRENIKPDEVNTVYLCFQNEDLKCLRQN
ncbi:MAG: ABC transporter ATP-binding protein [Dehalococcoidia bacterium]|nr:ABC transporter ATP-binding protein [Dehalococcoidia bacterium]